MRAVVFDRDGAFVTDEFGTKVLPSEGLALIEGDIAVGGTRGNRAPEEVFRAIRPDSGYTNAVIGRDTMYFTDCPRIPMMLPRTAKAMWESASDPASVEAVDTAVEQLLRYLEDDIWDSIVPLSGTDYRGSEFLEAVRIIADAVRANVTDTTMRTLICGRICAYRTFRGSMPDYVECMTPSQLSKEIYQHYETVNKEELR